VIVADNCFKHVNESQYRAKLLTNGEGQRFFKLDLKFMGQRVKVSSEMQMILSSISYSSMHSAQDLLEQCVTRCVVPYIKIEQEDYSSEIRSLAVMFVNLGVDLSSASSQEGLQKIQ